MKRLAMILSIVAVVACTRDQAGSTADTSAQAAAPAAPSIPADVQTALDVKRGIDAAPNRADSVLTAHGLTPAGFDSLMYRIAADSALRASFASAGR